MRATSRRPRRTSLPTINSFSKCCPICGQNKRERTFNCSGAVSVMGQTWVSADCAEGRKFLNRQGGDKAALESGLVLFGEFVFPDAQDAPAGAAEGARNQGVAGD